MHKIYAMKGLYIHIPFCKSRCIYCSFYSTTGGQQQEYLDALDREMSLRHDELTASPIRTLYIGGGTPSVLSSGQLKQLFASIRRHIPNFQPAEITIECNPDDMNDSLARLLAELGVNRVSMGVQTFDDRRLAFIHRRHSAVGAKQAVASLRRAGVRNISIDLIYGFPGQTLAQWDEDIRQALSMDVEHLSAYSLSYEEGTALYRMLEEERIQPLDEEICRQMFEQLVDRLTAAGYEHYEISNFAKTGFRSLHNSSYWQGIPYIGLGAAAHSFDGNSRCWNVSDVTAYIRGMKAGMPQMEHELLTAESKYDEAIMLGLRTREGINLELLERCHGQDKKAYCLRQARRFLSNGELKLEDGFLKLSRQGIFVSDMVMSELFSES